jgi:hypothetical protein
MPQPTAIIKPSSGNWRGFFFAPIPVMWYEPVEREAEFQRHIVCVGEVAK